MKKKAFLFAVISASLLASIHALYRRLDDGRYDDKALSTPAPDFTLTDAEGRTVTKADFAGRKFGMVFLRDGCGFCDQEIAQLNRLRTNFSSRMELLLVGIDAPTGAGTRGRFGSSNSRFSSARAAADYGATKTPTIYLIDERGSIAYSQEGLRSDEFMSLVFERFLYGESLEERALRAAYRKRAVKSQSFDYGKK